MQTLNKNAGEFSNEDEELLRSISHYVTIALENSRLYEEVKDYSEELKNTLLRIETLERVKGQLTKFVPSSVTYKNLKGSVFLLPVVLTIFLFSCTTFPWHPTV